MRIDASGNVGIGVTPSYKLHIQGAASSQMVLQSVDTDSTNKAHTIGGRHYTNSEEPLSLIGGFSISGAGEVDVGGGFSGGNAATRIAFYTAANTTTVVGTERMRIDASGNVGIGTTSTTERLRVESSDIYQFSLKNAGGGVLAALGVDTSSNLRFNVNSTERVRITSNGSLRVGSATGHVISAKQSLGTGTSFTLDLASIFSDVISIAGNFRYGTVKFFYFMSGRATMEEWLFAGTNAGVVAMDLVKRTSAGTAIEGTPTLTSSDNSTLSIALTTNASLAAGGAIIELTVV
jgi:hypothetical protein